MKSTLKQRAHVTVALGDLIVDSDQATVETTEHSDIDVCETRNPLYVYTWPQGVSDGSLPKCVSWTHRAIKHAPHVPSHVTDCIFWYVSERRRRVLEIACT